MTMVAWRIYYGDGTTFSNAEGDPSGAPRLNVQAIVQADVHNGWGIERTRDYYTWQEDQKRWRGVDIFGLFDYLFVTSKQPIVLAGRTIPDHEYNQIYQRAKADRDFARKSAFLPDERRPAVV